MFNQFTVLLLISCFWTLSICTADDAPSIYHEFPEQLVQSSSTDVLLRDRYTLIRSQKVDEISSSGGLTSNLQSNLPFMTTQQKSPGTQSSFIGLGRNSSDTNVQTLGVSLNSAQGGGYDLSTFPGFLWSSTRYQMGSSVGAYDPQGVGGTLSLKLWTDEALNASPGTSRFSVFSSTSELTQVSMGSTYGTAEPEAALLFGVSAGKMKGPSGSISGRWGSSRLKPGEVNGKFHLIGSKLDSSTPGSKSFSTPDAHQITQRVIPVAELNFFASEDWMIKSTVFYDSTVLKYEDVTNRDYSRDSIEQAGAEVVALESHWTVSGGYRDLEYTSVLLGQKSDQNYHLGVAYQFQALAHEWQPSFRGVGQSSEAMRPAGSLGLRHEYLSETNRTLFHFAKASYQPKFASLLDRYYSLSSGASTFKGNPGLKPEDTYTFSGGAEYRNNKFGAGLETQYQIRQNIQMNETVGTTTSPQNRGDAYLVSVLPTLSIYPFSFLDAHHSAVWSWSHVDQTKSEIAYVPKMSRVSRIIIHEPGMSSRWTVQVVLRSATGAYVSPTQRVTGYGMADIEGTINMDSLKISAKVDNVLNRIVEWVPDYPGPGRNYSLGLSANF